MEETFEFTSSWASEANAALRVQDASNTIVTIVIIFCIISVVILIAFLAYYYGKSKNKNN